MDGAGVVGVGVVEGVLGGDGERVLDPRRRRAGEASDDKVIGRAGWTTIPVWLSDTPPSVAEIAQVPAVLSVPLKT